MKKLIFIITLFLSLIISIPNAKALMCEYWIPDNGWTETYNGMPRNLYYYYKFEYYVDDDKNETYKRYGIKDTALSSIPSWPASGSTIRDNNFNISDSNAFHDGTLRYCGYSEIKTTLCPYNVANSNLVAELIPNRSKGNMISTIGFLHFADRGAPTYGAYYKRNTQTLIGDKTYESDQRDILKKYYDANQCPAMKYVSGSYKDPISKKDTSSYFQFVDGTPSTPPDPSTPSTPGTQIGKVKSACSYNNLTIDNKRIASIDFNITEEGEKNIKFQYRHNDNHSHQETAHNITTLSDIEFNVTEGSNPNNIEDVTQITFKIFKEDLKYFFPEDGACPENIYINDCTGNYGYAISTYKNVCLPSEVLEAEGLNQNIDTGNLDWTTGVCNSYLGNPTVKGEPAYYLQFAFDLIKYAAIIMLFVFTIVDFIKATAGNQDEIKKATQKAIKRLIIAIIIFFLPILIKFLLTVLGAYSPSTCGIK